MITGVVIKEAGMAVRLVNEVAYLASGPPRILIAICSCHTHASRREACRETWLKRLPDNAAAFFFVGSGESAFAEPDTVHLNVPDDYGNLTAKTIALLRYSFQAWPFDYLFKCDDDTYVSTVRLHELCGHDMCAHLWNNAHRSASGGAGYLLSRSLVGMLPGEINSSGYYEDVEVTHAARRLGASIVPTSRLRVGHERYPRPDNNLVTAHWCNPETLRRIDRTWPALPDDSNPCPTPSTV